MVGEPAGAVARRQRMRIARLERCVAQWARDASGVRGTGERGTAAVLRSLPADEWVVLHDLRWPGRPFAAVEHVAVGPAGVFVIESRRWTGRVSVADDVLRVGGRPRGRELLSVREAAAAIARRAHGVGPRHVTPVLCLARSDASGRAGEVTVCPKAELVGFLTGQPAVLGADEVRDVAEDLRHLQIDPAAAPVRRRVLLRAARS